MIALNEVVEAYITCGDKIGFTRAEIILLRYLPKRAPNGKCNDIPAKDRPAFLRDLKNASEQRIDMSEYIRKLNGGDGRMDYPMWDEVGDILITPDGIRWRIERNQTVGDLIHVGDTISTNYDTGGLVISIHQYSICCCPYRAISTTKLCYESWDEPAQTKKYHRELSVWSLIYVEADAPQFKNGKFHENDYRYLNELVCVNGRILKLFEANDDETFVVKDGIENHLQLSPF